MIVFIICLVAYLLNVLYWVRPHRRQFRIRRKEDGNYYLQKKVPIIPFLWSGNLTKVEREKKNTDEIIWYYDMDIFRRQTCLWGSEEVNVIACVEKHLKLLKDRKEYGRYSRRLDRGPVSMREIDEPTPQKLLDGMKKDGWND